jgi:hypothetical protein
VRLTPGKEAALDIVGAGLTCLLALAALPAVIVSNWLLATSFAEEADLPRTSVVAIIAYDLALAWALLVSKQRAWSRASVMLLAVVLAPAALLGAISLAERIAIERSHTVIH